MKTNQQLEVMEVQPSEDYFDDEPNPNNPDGMSREDLRLRYEDEMWNSVSFWI